MKNFWALLVLAFCLVAANEARALVIWGYDKSQAMEKKYRYFYPGVSGNCVTLQRNEDPTFILKNELNYLTGFGTVVTGVSGASCIQGLHHANVVLVTPRHILVAIHWGIWNGSVPVAFVGLDGKTYIGRTIPGYTALKTALGAVTDIGLIELQTAIPAYVAPLHIVDMAATPNLITFNTPTYVFGNIHLDLNYQSWQAPGNQNYKGVGTNFLNSQAIMSNKMSYTHGKRAFFNPQVNPSSTIWNQYWSTMALPYPDVGTAFPRLNDSGSITVMRAADSRGQMRLYLTGDHTSYDADSFIPGVLVDLRAKITAFNTARATNYTLNNTAPLPPKPIVVPLKDRIQKVEDLNTLEPALKTQLNGAGQPIQVAPLPQLPGQNIPADSLKPAEIRPHLSPFLQDAP